MGSLRGGSIISGYPVLHQGNPVISTNTGTNSLSGKLVVGGGTGFGGVQGSAALTVYSAIASAGGPSFVLARSADTNQNYLVWNGGAGGSTMNQAYIGMAANVTDTLVFGVSNGDRMTLNSSGVLTVAGKGVFGANTTGTWFQNGTTIPLYFINNDPHVGFNLYWNTTWKYGQGSSAKYGGLVGLDPSTGDLFFSTTPASGNADATATTAKRMVIDRNGNVSLKNDATATNQTTDAPTLSLVGGNWNGSVSIPTGWDLKAVNVNGVGSTLQFNTGGSTAFAMTYDGKFALNNGTNAGIIINNNAFVDINRQVTAKNLTITNGNSNGIGFWDGVGASAYAIWMSSTAGTSSNYGGSLDPDTANNDYNLYFNMQSNKRGFVWKSGSVANNNGNLMHLSGNGLYLNGLNLYSGSNQNTRETSANFDFQRENASIKLAMTTYTPTAAQGGGTFGNTSTIALRAARGNQATPVALTSFDSLGVLSFMGHNGAAWAEGASITVSPTQAWTSTAQGSQVRVWTTPNNLTGTRAHTSFQQDGTIKIESSTGALYISSDTNISRIAANILSTDDTFIAGGQAMSFQAATANQGNKNANTLAYLCTSTGVNVITLAGMTSYTNSNTAAAPGFDASGNWTVPYAGVYEISGSIIAYQAALGNQFDIGVDHYNTSGTLLNRYIVYRNGGGINTPTAMPFNIKLRAAATDYFKVYMYSATQVFVVVGSTTSDRYSFVQVVPL